LGRAAQPDVVERLTAAGVEIQTSTPQEFGQFVAAEVAKWARVVKDGNIRVE
jgi:tripartite-type tricarboxylate transporter receptor subunit TctC